MARLVFIRHAHSTANDAGILSGQLPGISLSKKGKKQAELLVDRLGSSHFDSIRVSPMQRCEETIAPWLKSGYSRGLKSYEIDEIMDESKEDYENYFIHIFLYFSYSLTIIPQNGLHVKGNGCF